MDRMARDLYLRAYAFLSSLRARVQNEFRACLNLYSSETWLVLYYPLFYFAKIVKKYPQWTAEQAQGFSSDWSFLSRDAQASLHVFSSIMERKALPFVIFGPLCYAFLLHYCFFDSRSWRTTSPAVECSESEEEPICDATSKAPEQLLQTIGLTEDQASDRQRKYGPNEIFTARNWFFVMLRLALRTTNLIAELAAALLAIILRDWTELVIISGLLVFSLFTAIQSIRQYDDVATTLVGDLSGFHNTCRGGTMRQVRDRELIPGDILHVEQGQTIMFEGQVVTSDGHFCTDQSNLTGQSTAVQKVNGDICYPSSGVVSGKATLMVVAIGHHTFIGRTLATVEKPMPPRTQLLHTSPPPQNVREYLGVLHSIGVTFGILAVAAVSVIWNFCHHINTSYPILSLSLGLAILGVLTSLNEIVANLRARGATRLLDQGAVLQAQQSTNAECLASIEIFCSDKTGTLTTNKLSLQRCNRRRGERCIFTDKSRLWHCCGNFYRNSHIRVRHLHANSRIGGNVLRLTDITADLPFGLDICCLSHHTLSLHLMCVLLGCFIAYNDVPDLNLVLLSIHFSDIIGIALASEEQHTPFSRNPVRWNTRRLWTSVIPFSAILTIGTWLSLAAITTTDDAASISAKRRQIVFLHAILSDHWPFLISRVDSRIRAQIRDWRAIATILSLDLLATLSFTFGWVSEGQPMSTEVAIHVWVNSFVTVCTATSLLIFILDEELCEMA